MKRIITTVLALLVLVALAQEAATQQAPNSNVVAVRVAHLIGNGPNADILLDGRVVFENVGAGTVSDYLLVPAGQQQLEIVAAGTGQARERQAQEARGGAAVGAETGGAETGGAETGGAIGAETGGAETGGATAQEGDSTLLQGLTENEDFSTLVGLIDQAGLTADLEGAGPFTILAPTNSVFQELDRAVLEQLNNDPALLESVLQAHVLQGAYEVEDLRDAEEGSIMTLQGEPLETDLTAGGLTVGGASLNSTNVDNTYSNGIVHEVGDVVLPTSLQNQLGMDDAETGGAETGSSERGAETGGAETGGATGTETGGAETGGAVGTETGGAETGGATVVVAFVDLDTDADGALTQEESQQVFRDNPDLFEQFDTNGSGDISEEEFNANQDLLGSANEEEQTETDAAVGAETGGAETGGAETGGAAIGAETGGTQQTQRQQTQQEGQQQTQTDQQQQSRQQDVLASQTLTLEAGAYYTIVASSTQQTQQGQQQTQQADQQTQQEGQQQQGQQGQRGALVVIVPVDVIVLVRGPNDFEQEVSEGQELSDLEPGTYTATATLQGQTVEQQVEVQSGQTAQVDLSQQNEQQGQQAQTGQQQQRQEQVNIQLGVIQDNLPTPPAGLALVRVVHASPDTPAINVVVTPSGQQAQGQQSQQEGQQTQQDTQQTQQESQQQQTQQEGQQQAQAGQQPGQLTVTVEPPQASGATVTVKGPDGFAQELTGGQTLSGLQPGSYIVSATLMSYQPAAQEVDLQAGSTAEVTLSLERLPEAGPAPIQGQTLISDLSFGSLSTYESVPADTYILQLQAVGMDVQVAEVTDLSLEPGVAYSVFVYGSRQDDTFGLAVTVDVLVSQEQMQQEQAQQNQQESDQAGNATNGAAGAMTAETEAGQEEAEMQAVGVETASVAAATADLDVQNLRDALQNAQEALSGGALEDASNEVEQALEDLQQAEGEMTPALQEVQQTLQQAQGALGNNDQEAAQQALQEAQEALEGTAP